MIEFESVGKTFRDGTAAVVDLSLQVPSGQITTIVGPSGCGKTTTLRMVNRMIEPSSGRITWDGTPLRSKRKTALRRQMGYVIQSGGLFPHRTVVDNIGTVPGLLGWSKTKTQKRSLELLENVGLDRKLADRYPAQLSGGQQQRVGVARALAADPLVMLMDEPFSAVDPVVRGELHEFFLDLQRRISKTIILITHDIDEAMKLGDQVAVMRVGGHLAQVGTPQQLLDEPADAFVEGFVGRDRGYRALSFQPASALTLEGVPVVRDVAAAAPDGVTLVVDGDARPVGWVLPGQPGRATPLGATFDVEGGTLRNALDAVLTSPVGLAVGVVPGSGRYAGVVSTATILAGVQQARVHHAESVTVQEGPRQPVAPGPDPEPTAPDPTDDVGPGHDHRGWSTSAGGSTALAPEDEHAATAELGDESGQDVDAETFGGEADDQPPADDRGPDEHEHGAAEQGPDDQGADRRAADLYQHESDLVTEESRAVQPDDTDVRR
ncbi:osmoprotectant transport system ATP-binding protein [Friedmanniella luteola]|uniref:ABC-type quaternary amine transporter n=1 Tax=Friedmanniella luteola TaxID=546871 RepID=A0A1H1ZWU1_9ACTN|nr:ABC transporter ATP-binding protein [Friedmanniella luteola]SDT37726.1 osmoprotectant transport system ATP-binding protein [Friedmanniella luteola]